MARFLLDLTTTTTTTTTTATATATTAPTTMLAASALGRDTNREGSNRGHRTPDTDKLKFDKNAIQKIMKYHYILRFKKVKGGSTIVSRRGFFSIWLLLLLLLLAAPALGRDTNREGSNRGHRTDRQTPGTGYG